MNKQAYILIALLLMAVISAMVLAGTGASAAKQEKAAQTVAVQETQPPPGQFEGPPMPHPCSPDLPPGAPPQDINGPCFQGPGGHEGFRAPMHFKPGRESIEKAERMLKEYDPVKYREVMAIKEKDEMLYTRVISDVARDMQFLGRMKDENPELFKCMVEEKALESSCHELLKSLRGNQDQAKVGRVKEELRKKLSRMFDLRQRAREEKIRHIERDIAELKQKQEIRKKNREKIIELRLTVMMGGAEGLEW